MKIYAQLNENNICTGISQLSGEVLKDDLIEIPTFSQEYMWKKYDKILEVWSVEKFEPISTAPITEFEQLKKENQELKQSIADITMLIASTQTPTV